MRLILFLCILLLAGCRATKQSIAVTQSDTLSEAVASSQSRNWNRDIITEFFLPGLTSDFRLVLPVSGRQMTEISKDVIQTSGLPNDRSVKPGHEQTPVIIRQIIRESSADTSTYHSEKKAGNDLKTISTPSPPPARPWRIFCAGALCGIVLSVILLRLLRRLFK